MMELEPFGVTSGMDGARPVMLFREKGGEAVLPVWLSPLDAGIALTQHNVKAVAMSPHDVGLNVLRELGVKVKCCRFTELKGNQQYVVIEFTGSRKLKSLRFRADHAISFCLQARTRFFCTRAYLQECRDVEATMEKVSQGIKHKLVGRKNTHPYLN
jgi:bifunctional DNase/RNase